MQSTFTNPEFISLLGLLLVSGAFAGLLAGLFGVGGGIILVPALLYAFDELGYSNDVTAHMAVGTSLAIIVPTSITSAWSHYKRGSGNIILFRKLAFLCCGTTIAKNATYWFPLNLLQKSHSVYFLL